MEPDTGAVVVGASGWEYYVPYQEDLGAALDALRRRVFETGDYYWDPDAEDDGGKPRGRPSTLAELWEDERVQEEGTHSILDMHRMLRPGEEPDYCTVQPVQPLEARRLARTDRPTRAHINALEPLAARSWFGRCAVLHDAGGRPEEIYFWGFSGD
ncbi:MULTISPECIES: hypothetical protein [unclassified Streptomyces]|uniref:hypothetical protein n=1 Tax=unclassified Streptomyces TaxID=2593676 RepID=UPI001EF92AF2|nr:MULTISPECIES: hypothetical protein [unclassified Streptomyces]